MRRYWKVLTGVAAVAVLVAAVAGSALAHWFGGAGAAVKPVATVAQKLGMTEQELVTALQGGKSVAELAQEKGVSLAEVKQSLLSQIDAMLDTALNTRGIGPALFGGGPRGHHGPKHPGPKGPGSMMQAVQQALGVTQEEFVTAIRAGKSIADLATEKNVSLDSVKAAALAAHQADLDKLVADGRLTQEQAAAKQNQFAATIDRFLTQAHKGPGPGRGGHRPGPRRVPAQTT